MIAREERGIALVVVLWVLALLGVVAATFLRDTRVETRVTSNLVANAKAEALAEAGVQRAMLGLIDPNDETAWRADGRSYAFSMGEESVSITMQSEAGKIDLNQAHDETLFALFELAGLSAGDAIRLVDAVADFRDPDHERRPAGAEDADYAAAGLARGAKNAPFETADELLQVLGMSRELFDRVSPSITVYSHRRIDPAAAPPMVLQVLRQVMPEQLDQILAARRDNDDAAYARPRTIKVRAEARITSGGALTREVVIQRTDNPADPFRILEWRQHWSEDHQRSL